MSASYDCTHTPLRETCRWPSLIPVVPGTKTYHVVRDKNILRNVSLESKVVETCFGVAELASRRIVFRLDGTLIPFDVPKRWRPLGRVGDVVAFAHRGNRLTTINGDGRERTGNLRVEVLVRSKEFMLISESEFVFRNVKYVSDYEGETLWKVDDAYVPPALNFSDSKNDVGSATIVRTDVAFDARSYWRSRRDVEGIYGIFSGFTPDGLLRTTHRHGTNTYDFEIRRVAKAKAFTSLPTDVVKDVAKRLRLSPNYEVDDLFFDR